MGRLCAVLLSLLVAGSSALAQTASPSDAPQIGQQSKDSVWVPTPERLIRRMLQIADTTRDDLVVDLGAGDGRIPIYAAEHFGARAVGVELEGNLVRVAREAARARRVENLVTFVQQDLFEYDLSSATVIALYISPGVMTKLKPRFLQLRPGTRIVSHYFTLEDWEPDETIRAEGRSAHLWVVPAPLQGTWAVSAGGEDFVLRVEQKYQALKTSGVRGSRAINVIGAQLRGTEIRFTSFDRDGAARHYRGSVEGGRMTGRSEGQDIQPVAWSARRLP